MDLWPDAPKPGLYKGVAWETYARWNAANHSLLRHFSRSAAHAQYAMTHGDDGTKAKDQGHATHVAMLEPDRFVAEYVGAPKVDRRYKKDKEVWAEFVARNADKTVLTQEQYDLAGAMTLAVWRHPAAAELLRGGLNEVSFAWRDPDTGVPCKARMDHLGTMGEWSFVVDLKTSKNAKRSSFERDVYNFGYHQQAAMYLDGANAVRPRERKYAFVVVESEPPHCVAVYEMDEEAINLGRDEYKAHLRAYSECVRTGVWPAYPDGIDYVSVPTWAFKAVEAGA